MHITESIADDIIALTFEASALLKRYFQTTFHIQYKEDDSPVTEADTQANHLLVEGLKRITPQVPIIAEESSNTSEGADLFWLVDPLDGTRAFVRGEEAFTINIGLVEHGSPVFGVLALPMRNAVYVGGRDRKAQKITADGTRTAIACRVPDVNALRVVKSSVHTSRRMQAYLKTLPVANIQSYSSAMKFALVAEGSADLYPRFGRTMEWDTAAGQAIVEAAGGCMQTLNGEAFTYGKPRYENAGFIVKGWKGC